MYKRRAYKHKCLKKIYGRYIWKIDQILEEMSESLLDYRRIEE